MKEKSYNTITIKEIALKAALDRSTFYRNFDSKEDVLNFHLDVLSQDYIHRIEQSRDVDTKKVFRIFLEFCNDHLEFFCSLRRNGLTTFLLEAFNSRLGAAPQLLLFLSNSCFMQLPVMLWCVNRIDTKVSLLNPFIPVPWMEKKQSREDKKAFTDAFLHVTELTLHWMAFLLMK